MSRNSWIFDFDGRHEVDDEFVENLDWDSYE